MYVKYHKRTYNPKLYYNTFFYFLFPSGEISRIAEKIQECTEYGINLQLEMEEYIFEAGLATSENGVNEPGIIKLEHSLLDTAGCPNLLNGLFYMLPLYTNGHLYIRYKNTNPNFNLQT